MSSEKRNFGKATNQDHEIDAQDSREEPVENGLPIDTKSHQDPLHAPMTISPSPPKQVTIDQLAEAANSFYKMSLVHEISVDSNFKMERKEEPLERGIKETMHRAFWDVQRSHLNADPPNYEPALGLLKEIRQSLESLTLPHQTTLRAQIAERLDIETAEVEWRRTGHLRLEAFAEPLVEMLAQWCAPVRDPDVARLRDISDPIEFFRQAFAVLELMHMDLANFTIRKMRPYIRQQAGVYEREKFDTLLKVQERAGIDGLAITREWIREAFETLQNQTSSDGAPLAPPTPNNILREAYLALLVWQPTREFPETVAVDAKRILELSDCLARTVTLASLVLVVCNAVATASVSLALCTPTPVTTFPLASLKAAVSRDARGIIDGVPSGKIPQLAEVLNLRMLLVVDNWRKSLYEGDSEFKTTFTSEGSCPVMPDNCLPEPFKEQITSQINAVLRMEHPVYKLMFSRAVDFLRSALSARPPDPIPLPAGFGALSESTTSIPACQPSVPLDPSVCAMEKPSMNLRVDMDGDTDSVIPNTSSVGSASISSSSSSAPVDLSRVYDLALIASRLMPLVAHNRHVFGPHYAEIIHDLLKPARSD
ncbi:t complex protein 11 protein 1 [Echinococcus multilocularis]|uniref:T complex protein 11 protein 1 n=2 Tax=Echinococcus multilocularis TaxID=6211 RepID=A0A068Y175_ECHMU|nr:t complex protein 11 protein 1 [Echinococcus multilocularis]